MPPWLPINAKESAISVERFEVDNATYLAMRLAKGRTNVQPGKCPERDKPYAPP